MIDTIIKYIKLLRPKYYNTITRIIVVAGIALLSKPIWIDILNLFLGNFKLSIIGEFDWALGLLIIFLSLTYNLIHRYIDLKHDYKSKPAFESVKDTVFKEFGELCQEILPILKDNEYVFKNTGPNSDISNLGEMRTDLTLWHKLREEVIIPNNKAIANLIAKNQSVIPAKYSDTFQRMSLHIKAFEEHIKNSRFDYSNFQFPQDFATIVSDESQNRASRDQSVITIKKWLSKKSKHKIVRESFLFGSCLFTPQKSNDVDVIILSESDKNEVYQYIDNLKFDFKIKFKKELHVTTFFKNNIDYQTFLDKNPIKFNL